MERPLTKPPWQGILISVDHKNIGLSEMKFSDFKRQVQKLPFFSVSHLSVLTEKRKLLENQLATWEKQGKILRLKRGFYLLGPEECRAPVSKMLVANQLLSPSYVSMEYALSFYGLIPERTHQVTSITTKKTSHFENALGSFNYQHVKPVCFTGFVRVDDENHLPILIAEPEKAVMDLLYLNLSALPNISEEIFTEFYRFQNVENLRIAKIKRYSVLFQTKKLDRVTDAFVHFLKKTETRRKS